jgi:glycosyltransferase involved in cell wall biosynthesis
MATVRAIPEYRSSETCPAGPRVALLVGNNETLHCGVKDYARKLAEVLRVHRIHAEVLAPPSWNRAGFMTFWKERLQGQYDLFHVQYPSIGMKASLMPHALGAMCGRQRTLITIHECSALPRSQRAALQLFRGTAGTILLCTDFERAMMNRYLGRLGAKQRVVPIGSNIPRGVADSRIQQEIIYFGQIRRNKGIEAFLDLAELSLEKGFDFKFHIVGGVPASQKAYAEALMLHADQRIRWSCGLSSPEVAQVLANGLAAYLPFPDGAGERRGSLLAALENGLPVLSREGPATTPELRKAFFHVDSRENALKTLIDLQTSGQMRNEMAERARHYASRRDWDVIATEHAQIYSQALRLPAFGHSGALPA